jgi:predicted NBD/HSP70 family sugar kinase
LATPATVRKINGAAALAALFRKGPMTRADLARHLDLTKASVTSIAAQLEAGGYLQGGEAPEPGRIGRPGTFVQIRPQGASFIGIEIGVDRMNAVTMDLAGQTPNRLETHGEFPGKPQAYVIDAVSDLYREATLQLGDGLMALKGVRVAVPGYVRDRSYLIDASILGWRQMPLGRILSDKLGVEVLVENDANASAFAEWYLREDLRDLSIYLILLETGVGGACIAEGTLASGRNGLAGELGHIRFPMSADGSTRMGRSPALQDLIGKGAFLARLRERGVEVPDLAAVQAALAGRNPAALAVVDDWASTLGMVAAQIALICDVDHVVIGGELAAVFSQAEPTIQNELGAILPPGFPIPTLSRASFVKDGGAVGAAALGHAHFLKSV